MNNTIPAVEKTVQLLLALAAGEKTQAELSAELGISMSTAYRILTTLQAHRWVRKRSGAAYSLAEGVLPLARGISPEIALLECAERKVSELVRRHDIACKLSVREGDRQLTCFRAEPPGPVSLTGRNGSSFPLIEGSVGAALLSEDSEAEIAALAAACRDDIPEKGRPELILAGIREVRERGTVLNASKNRWHIAALSIPLHGRTGAVIAALTLIGGEEDFTGGKRRCWDKIMKECAAECENPESGGKTQ